MAKVHECDRCKIITRCVTSFSPIPFDTIKLKQAGINNQQLDLCDSCYREMCNMFIAWMSTSSRG